MSVRTLAEEEKVEIRQSENFIAETLEAEEIDFQGEKMRRVEVTVKEIAGPIDMFETRPPGAVDTLLIIEADGREITSNVIEIVNFSYLFLYRGGLYLISNGILSRICFEAGVFYLRECFLQSGRELCKVRFEYQPLPLIDYSTSPETLIVLSGQSSLDTKANTLFRCGTPERFANNEVMFSAPNQQAEKHAAANCFEVLFERKLPRPETGYDFFEVCSKSRIWLTEAESDILRVFSPDFSDLFWAKLTSSKVYQLEKRNGEISLVYEDGSVESLSFLERYFD